MYRKTNGVQTDRQNDRQTYIQTDIVTYRGDSLLKKEIYNSVSNYLDYLL